MTTHSMDFDAQGLDEILEELREIDRELASTNDLEQRFHLGERRRELRARAATHLKDSRTHSEIQTELDHLRRLRDEIFEGHISVGHIGGGNGPGGGGMEPRYVFAMNREIDRARGRAEIEERIRALEAELERLEGSGTH